MSELALEARLEVIVGKEAQRFELDAQLRLERGVLVLFGPSGAGKSLTVQALAGLVSPARGAVRVQGEVLLDRDRGIDVPAHRRRIGYVPQQNSLLPFCDVEANVAFGLARRERRRGNPRVGAMLEECRIDHLARARPESLSGGERQRVALARALVVEPRLLLLDEPFAAIDREGRAELRETIRTTLERHSIPAVIVTHDAEDALALGDTMVCYERGRTVRTGVPAELLPDAQSVIVKGRASDPARRVAGNRVEVQVQSVRIEGPEALLQPGSDGALHLELYASPAARRASPDRSEPSD